LRSGHPPARAGGFPGSREIATRQRRTGGEDWRSCQSFTPATQLPQAGSQERKRLDQRNHRTPKPSATPVPAGSRRRLPTERRVANRQHRAGGETGGVANPSRQRLNFLKQEARSGSDWISGTTERRSPPQRRSLPAPAGGFQRNAEWPTDNTEREARLAELPILHASDSTSSSRKPGAEATGSAEPPNAETLRNPGPCRLPPAASNGTPSGQPTTPSRRRGPQFGTNLWLRAELPSKTGQEGSFALKSVTAPRPADGMDAKLHCVAWLIGGRHKGA